MFLRLLKIAIINIVTQKKQSLLTMLGMIIGIASVITVFSVGSGAQSLITSEIQNIGTNLMAVIPGKSEEGGGPPPIARGIIVTSLKEDDAKAIESIPEVDGVLPMVIGNSVVSYKNQSESTPFVGTGYRMLHVMNVDIAEGRYFNEREEQGFARVAVLGPNVKEKLFGSGKAVGKTLKIDQRSFRVIGVLESKGTSLMSIQDDYFFIPFKTAQKQLLGIDYLHVLRFKAAKEEYVPYLTDAVTKLIRRRHKINNPKNDDFSVQTQAQALDTLGNVTSALTFFLTAIAGISLLVGGVGIMNMMLVTVTRRTREIGLRKAVGAKNRHIVMQFLMESGVLTIAGGIIGVIFGILFSALVSVLIQGYGLAWTFEVTISSVVIATSISLAIGIIFGMYPAIKASRLHPIEALRYE